ncbi:Thionin-2.2 [Thalictrum thalictroides]|uniref:Thionin-2.2 n=1 Tax=Thalictrum thalictroides TaxID=46969 RepID=A0A7J6VPY7_THATH|nr:Thionin-2.2 [Thalictrum thalictroides]
MQVLFVTSPDTINTYLSKSICWQSDILGNSGINEYCKLGCASSVCEAISTLQISDAGEEVVNGAVEQCTEACSAFCTKGSLEIA